MSRYRRTGQLPDDLRQTIDEFRDQVIADQSGLESLTALRAETIRAIVDAKVLRALAMAEVVEQSKASRRLHNKAGQEAAKLVLACLDRIARLSADLGLDRRAKPISDLDLDDYLTNGGRR